MARGRKLPKYLTKLELQRLLSQADPDNVSQQRDLCMLRVMAMGGLRVSEACNLRPDHVDLDAGRVRVRNGKGGKDRETWIDLATCQLINEYLECRPPGRYLFQTRNRQRVNPSQLRRVTKRYARRAGVSEPARVSPHSLRHTFAVFYLEANPDDLRGLQILLGHESIEVTQIYAHIVDSRLRERVAAAHKQLQVA